MSRSDPPAFARHSRLTPNRWQSAIATARLLLVAALAFSMVACNRSWVRPDNTETNGPTSSSPTPELPAEPPSDEPAFYPTATATAADADTPSTEETALEPVDLWQRMRLGFQLEHPINPRTERELRRLTRSPHHVESLLRRGEPYFHLILEQIEQRALPTELVLLPAVESAYRPTAYSYSGAAGLWQFMPATGRRAGLRLDDWYDGRRDVFDSTDAALGLLERLNARFDGDWLRALAAYNAGPARVSIAMRRNVAAGRSTQYWDLELPRETDDYVPRLLALAEIVARPEHYGIELPEVPNEARLDRIDAGERTDLRVAAQVAGLDKDEMLRLNAGYKAMTTLPDGPHWIVVPVDAADRLSDELAKLDKDQRLPARDLRHRIKRGETLGGIARRYGVSVSALKRANHLHNHLIRAGRKLVIPGRLETIRVAELGLSESTLSNPGRVRHRVVKGDSLYLIARRYKVSVKQLRRWNDIRGKLIKPGQELTVFVRRQSLAL